MSNIKIKIQSSPPDTPIEQTDTLLSAQVGEEKPPFDLKKIGLVLLLICGTLALLVYTLGNQQDDNSQHLEVADSNVVAEITESPTAEILLADEPEPYESKIEEAIDLPVSADDVPLNSATLPLAEVPAETQSIEEPDSDSIDLKNITEEIATTPSEPPSNMMPDHPTYVARAQLTSAIKQREPIDLIDEILLDPGIDRRIYLFVQIKNLSDQSINIRWYYQNEIVAEVPLYIGGQIWRTNASKLLNGERMGAWHVTVVDQSGKHLVRRDFTVINRP